MKRMIDCQKFTNVYQKAKYMTVLSQNINRMYKYNYYAIGSYVFKKTNIKKIKLIRPICISTKYM